MVNLSTCIIINQAVIVWFGH